MLSHPYICGIGGIGTSGVALLLSDLQIPVMGSDLRRSELTQMLEARGIRISYRPNLEGVEVASCVVVPAFFPKNHPELEAARANHIPILERTEALALISREHVKQLTLVLGTQERARVARAIAEEEKSGYCTGMATCEGACHAKFGENLVMDLDERSFFHHPELYAAFGGARVYISDWAQDDYGYYPTGFNCDELCKKFELQGCRVEFLATDHHWICSAPQALGWFEPIREGWYHEIRMHPVNVATALKKMRRMAQDALVLAVIRPFISTLKSYDIAIWSEVLSFADKICVISPPYEGCTPQDCIEFVKKLCDSSLQAHVCSHQDAHELASSMPYSLWIGAPDIVSGL